MMSVDIGKEAPAIALPDAAEAMVHDLADALKNGPAIIGIYKSSCQASKTMFTMLQRLRLAYPEDRLTIWGVAQDSSNVTRSFARRTGVTFPILVEGNEYPISREYGIEATPTVYLINQEGKVVWQAMGFQKPAMDELSTKIAELLGMETVDVTSGTDDIPNWVPG
jgi:peroxiredoxin